MKSKLARVLVVAAVIGLGSTRAALASTIVLDITLDTSPLTTLPGSASGPFFLFFQMTDGSGLGNGNNTVTLDSFSFGGGSAVPGPTVDGGGSGNLSSGVSLTDTSFFNSFVQGFTPGSVLSFRLSFTNDVEPGGTPDAFGFSVLDASGFAIATVDPSLADTFLAFDIDSLSPVARAYGTDLARTDINIGAPTAEAAGSVGSPVPEPSSLLLLGAGLAGMLARRARRAKTSVSAIGRTCHEWPTTSRDKTR